MATTTKRLATAILVLFIRYSFRRYSIPLKKLLQASRSLKCDDPDDSRRTAGRSRSFSIFIRGCVEFRKFGRTLITAADVHQIAQVGGRSPSAMICVFAKCVVLFAARSSAALRISRSS